jgi:hypothetical protein
MEDLGGGITVVAKCNYLPTQPKRSWMRCVLLHAPHPNYWSSLLDFARVLETEVQAGPRKPESFARNLRSPKLLSRLNDHTVYANGPCSLRSNRAP